MKITMLSKIERNLAIIIRKSIKETLDKLVSNPRPLLNDEQAAKFLNVAKGTLPVWRNKGKGPRYLKIENSVRFQLSDLRKYISENTIDPSK